MILDAACRHVWMKITGSPSNWEVRDWSICEHMLLLEQVQGSIWVTLDTKLNLAVEDVAEFVPVIPGQKSLLQQAGRPLLVMAPLDRTRLKEYQSQARAMAALHRGPLGTAGPSGAAPAVADDEDGRWYFADTGHPQFGLPVPIDFLSVVEHVRQEYACGLVRVTEANRQMRWTFMELVPSDKFELWLRDKRHGAGRRVLDARLSPLTDVTGMVVVLPSFQECSLHHSPPSVPLVSVYEGPSAYNESSAAIVDEINLAARSVWL